jgi:DNA-binding transcriptional regulator YhcF (GntR family)
MLISIDFNSSEAIYVQLCDQIIYLIANDDLKEGDSLPSVRDLAEAIGINMHTVNKAYGILRQEGYVKLDRRHGAVVSLECDKKAEIENLKNELRNVVARASCRGITRGDLRNIVDSLYDELETKMKKKME